MSARRASSVGLGPSEPFGRTSADATGPAGSVIGRPSVLEVPGGGELLHEPLLLRRERLGHDDPDLHEQVTRLAVVRDALAAHAESLAARGPARECERDLAIVERHHGDLRAERRLRDVHRRVHDEVKTVTLEVGVVLHLERDEDVARWPAAKAGTTLPLQPYLRAALRAARHRDEDLLVCARRTGAVAGVAPLRGYLSLAEAHRARTIHCEPALTERDGAATLA